MSRNEYFFVFETIIYSLALAEILVGTNKMISNRKEIRLYWTHTLAVLLYGLILITHYNWEFYRNAFDLVNSTIDFILLVVVFPISYFIGLYQAFPRNFKNVDLKEFFHSHKKEILIPVMIMQAALVNKSCFEVIAVHGYNYLLSYLFKPEGFYIWIQLFFIVFISMSIVSKRKWVVEALIVVGLLRQTQVLFNEFSYL